MILPGGFLNFTAKEFCFGGITQMVLCAFLGLIAVIQQSVDTLFPKYQVKFLDNDRLVFICFYQLFKVSSEPLLKKTFEKFFCVTIPDQRGHHMLTIFGVVKLVDVKKYCVDIFLYSKHHGE